MSFREKSAWIALASALVCFGAYFGAVLTGLAPRGMGAVGLLVVCVIAFAVLQAGLTAAAAWTTPRDGRSAFDEREMLIQSRSHTVGYYVLTALVLTLAIPGHLGHPVADLLNFALLDVVAAGVAVAVAQIVMFRRGL